ncbi:GDSL esterase/lipase At5g55050 [Cajanus cajan]|uniref:GDSL esterase/lipase At5g55050 family n=1 Tax=Cajanus cajan TaxID=3821 RepID=A0A151U263_CAJCA|nr:GDSL esterase/lipase At5g55050 [Cajanus cajan]KYP73419.1 GDSL esterase/lipase At5g55050 family [Cajanus cajan]
MVNRGLISISILYALIFSFGSSKAQMVPAVYVFGDSLVDVGNNNYLPLSVAKANHRHYGIDFPTHKPTGRFSNGKNAADLVAEKLGLATSPPYLSLKSKTNKNNASFMDGVSFASSGAGIFDGRDERYGQSIPLTKQVDYYSIVHEEMIREVGAADLQNHLSKSIFVLVIGSNDLFGYFESSDLRKKNTPQQYVDSMAFSLKVQLQRLYDQGARKFEIAGVGTLGCVPVYRLKNKTECVEEVNYWSKKYNEGLRSMLKEWQSENGSIIYSYFDTYAAINDIIQSPPSYGFTEVKGACCGVGELNARATCLPLSNLCPNRQDHLFFDQFHPTEAASRILVDRLFNGSSSYTSPINMRQLIHA